MSCICLTSSIFPKTIGTGNNVTPLKTHIRKVKYSIFDISEKERNTYVPRDCPCLSCICLTSSIFPKTIGTGNNVTPLKTHIRKVKYSIFDISEKERNTYVPRDSACLSCISLTSLILRKTIGTENNVTPSKAHIRKVKHSIFDIR